MRGEPKCKKRCIISLEAATSSRDAPSILHRLELEVPANGSTLSVSLQARMMESAESTTTVPVPAMMGNPGHCSNAVEMATEPDLMPSLEFSEYEALFKAWQAGLQTLKEIQAQYGKEVVELLQSQGALIEAEDQELKCEERGASEGEMRPAADLVVKGRNPMCAVGQPKPRFGFFESMFGQWKRGERDDRNVLEEFGTIWLELFRAWKQWGLDAIYPSLMEELDMTNVETDEKARPTIPPLSLVSVPIRIPFSVIRDVYHR